MSRQIKLQMLRAGSCRHLECMADRGGRLSQVAFPALCGLIRHPSQGWILYDTGYSEHFFTATESLPERLYRMVLPVRLPPSEYLPYQLEQLGITTADIGTVIVSHYHGDHIAGLRDFPKARFIALSADTRSMQVLRGHRWKATYQGQLPGLLPEDYLLRLTDADKQPPIALPSWMKPFNQGFDLLGDGSLIGVPLPGHSHGQLGLFLPDADGRPIFLVADACWSMTACLAGRLPSRLTMFVSADRRRYESTFFGLHTLAVRESSLTLLPSHCTDAWQAFNHAER